MIPTSGQRAASEKTQEKGNELRRDGACGNSVGAMRAREVHGIGHRARTEGSWRCQSFAKPTAAARLSKSATTCAKATL